MMVASYLFGGLFICISCPEAWENDQIWDATNSPIAGGHAVWSPGYDNVNNPKGLAMVTWGGVRLMTLAGSDQHTSQIVVSVPTDWIADNNLAPSGFDVPQLLADEAAL
jgi:hypothetical protein